MSGEEKYQTDRGIEYVNRTNEVIRRAVEYWQKRTGNKITPELATLIEWLLAEAKRLR